MKIGTIKNIVPIIADGCIANPKIGDGRMIPVLVVDCKNQTELIDLCLIQADTPPGDVTTRWFRDIFDRKHVYLELSFEKPVRITTNIKFDIGRRGTLVYGIIISHAFYLQPSSFAMTASEGFGKPNIIVEVPPQVVPPLNWDATCVAQIAKGFKREGYSDKQARETAKQHVQRAKEFWTIRTRGEKPNPPEEHSTPVEPR